MINSEFILPLGTNPILKTDSYKFSHPLQLRPGTTKNFYYMEARGFKEGYSPYVVSAGMHRFIKEYMMTPFCEDHILDAETFCRLHNVPFNAEDYWYILEKYNGYWPVIISAVPEGTIVPVSNIMVSIINYDDRVPWVGGFIETIALRYEWTMSTVATICSNIKEVFYEYAEKTSSMSFNSNFLDYKLHDFGARGCSDPRVGLGHLMVFKGSDNVEAIASVVDTYECESIPATSVPAAEHSTITSWGKENETEAYSNLIDKFGGIGKIYSAPIDSYDMKYAVDNIIGTHLKQKILEKGGTFVCRLDSGIPIESVMFCLESLGKTFGYEVNQKGYKVLNPAVRILQGDGVDLIVIRNILLVMEEFKWSIDNIIFGAGGAILQHMDRDWFQWAMKCSATQINNEWIDVYKDPKEQPSKASKRGRLMLVRDKETAELKTIRNDITFKNELITIYNAGSIRAELTWEEVVDNYSESFDLLMLSKHAKIDGQDLQKTIGGVYD